MNRLLLRHKVSTGNFLLLAVLFCLSVPLFGQNLSVNINVQEPTCNGFTNGIATANASGGSGAYSYAWNTGATGQEVVGGAGTYSVTVTDTNGATASSSVVMGEASAVTASISNTGSICTNPGDITVNASGGVGNYAYNWSNGSTNATQTGLAAGNYCVTVTDNGGTGCGVVTCTTITNPLDVSLNIINVTCFNGCDASIEAAVNGGIAPYSFQWSNGITAQTNINLLPGTYTVTVTDGNGCQVVETATVANGITIDVGVQTTDANCGNNPDGTATFSATGGFAPYTYTVSGGADPNNLAPGTYTVIATDVNGCQGDASFTIGGGSNLDLTITNNFECGDVTGSATASVNGGSGNYSYEWSDGQTGATATGLAANATYNLTVTDNATGCTTTGSTFIMGLANVDVAIASMNPSCNGDINGSATATATGGAAPYTYSWSNGATTRTINNLGAGTYTVMVADANGCGGMATVTITEPASVSIDFNTTNATCDDPMSGSATAIATGGTAPYTYLWSNGTTTATISNVGAGSYAVTVTDVNGCFADNMVAITAPASNLTVNTSGTNISCNGAADGTATATAMNGSGNYTYTWSNGQSGATITGLGAGTYTVTASDGQCTATGSVTITEPARLDANVTVSGGGGCSSTATGTATVVVTGGTAPYSYSFSDGQSGSTADNLASGNYTVTITDANGCTTTESFTIAAGSDVNVSVTTTDSNCAQSNAGTARAMVAGGTAPYTFAWSNGADVQVLMGLDAGTYTVTVTDANGCTAVGSGTINNATDIDVTVSTTSTSCDGRNDGAAQVSATGGTAPYTYEFSNGQSGTATNNLSAGSYEVTVTDANGCTAVETFTIDEGSNVVVTVETTDSNCDESNAGTARAVVSGGTAPYTYSWSNGADVQVLMGLGVGTYTVTVTDANGCTNIASGTVSNATFINVNVLATSNTTCNNTTDGSAQVNATGGTAPYTYSWSNGRTGDIQNNLGAGTYTVTATDANGCTGTTTVTIGSDSDLEVEVMVWNPECGDNSNGKVMAMPSGGTGEDTYTFSWNTGDTGQALENVSAGQYCVTITDEDGCTASDCEDLMSVESPTATITVLQEISANGANDGSLQVSATGGQAPYGFQWSTGASTPVITGLGAGIYSVTVTDVNLCTSVAEVILGNPGKIGDKVFDDANKDGIQGVNEGGVFGVRVRLQGTDENGFSVLRETTTSPAGNYLFDGLNAGSYTVIFSDLPGSYQFSPANQGGNDDLDSDADPVNGFTPTVTLETGGCITNIDAGAYQRCVNAVDPGQIGFDQRLCGEFSDPDPFVNLQSPSGAGGDYRVFWMRSPVLVPFTNNQWEIIPGATSLTYDSGPIQNTTYFARCVVENGCSLITESNILEVEITQDPEVCGGGLANDINITARVVGSSTVEVMWTIPADEDVYTYQVERSTDHSGNYVMLSEDVRMFELNGVNHYSFVDDSPKMGRSMYRIGYADINGMHHSQAGEVNIAMPEFAMVYPNPVEGDEIMVELFTALSTDLDIQVMDSSGRKMNGVKMAPGAMNKKLSVAGLNPGIYFVRIIRADDSEPLLLKVIKR